MTGARARESEGGCGGAEGRARGGLVLVRERRVERAEVHRAQRDDVVEQRRAGGRVRLGLAQPEVDVDALGVLERVVELVVRARLRHHVGRGAPAGRRRGLLEQLEAEQGPAQRAVHERRLPARGLQLPRLHLGVPREVAAQGERSGCFGPRSIRFETAVVTQAPSVRRSTTRTNSIDWTRTRYGPAITSAPAVAVRAEIVRQRQRERGGRARAPGEEVEGRRRLGLLRQVLQVAPPAGHDRPEAPAAPLVLLDEPRQRLQLVQARARARAQS